MDRKSLYLKIKILILGANLFFLFSCEGPIGQPGEDANESCKLCHNPNVVDYIITQYQLSKHATGETAMSETGNVACAPCHESTGFKFVCANNVPATITLNATTGKFANNYVASDSTSFGEFTCNTCHSSIHKNFDTTDFYPLTTTAPVAMNMWAGTKVIDLQVNNNGKGNLCIKCHQPRPITTSTSLSDGNVVDYASLIANPTTVYYDSAVGNAKPNKLIPSYRFGIHYGAVGAIYTGTGGIEYSGSLEYSNSKHLLTASCKDCHMVNIFGGSGGHTFNSKGNYRGCNVSGCHDKVQYNSSSADIVNTQNEIRTLLGTLASRLKSGNIEFLHRDNDATTNLWAGITTNNYDGYLNIYDPSTNPGGALQNPAPAKSWTDAQKSTNKALPKFTSLKNVQLGAIINFQLCLREKSLGMHNYEYSRALLTNTLDALTAAGY
jgi:hypothetical protein